MSDRVLSDVMRVGRKDYRCYLCRDTIAKGEQHWHRTGVTDDEFWDIRIHKDCDQVTVDHKWDIDDWECFDSVEFRDELQEWREEQGKAETAS